MQHICSSTYIWVIWSHWRYFWSHLKSTIRYLPIILEPFFHYILLRRKFAAYTPPFPTLCPTAEQSPPMQSTFSPQSTSELDRKIKRNLTALLAWMKMKETKRTTWLVSIAVSLIFALQMPTIPTEGFPPALPPYCAGTKDDKQSKEWRTWSSQRNTVSKASFWKRWRWKRVLTTAEW